MTTTELLEAEHQIELEFHAGCKEEGICHEPVTDGVVDAELYLSSYPKILWVLREPWEELGAGEFGGGWSVAKHVAARKITSNRGALPIMAYIAYAAFNSFPLYEQMEYATDDPRIGDALKRIALINIKKVPGGKSSYAPEIASHFRRNRALLLRQIELYSPDVVIGGGTLRHFYTDLGVSDSSFNKDRSAWHCTIGSRLLIHANHPAQRRSIRRYVDDISAILKEQKLNSGPPYERT